LPDQLFRCHSYSAHIGVQYAHIYSRTANATDDINMVVRFGRAIT